MRIIITVISYSRKERLSCICTNPTCSWSVNTTKDSTFKTLGISSRTALVMRAGKKKVALKTQHHTKFDSLFRSEQLSNHIFYTLDKQRCQQSTDACMINATIAIHSTLSLSLTCGTNTDVGSSLGSLWLSCSQFITHTNCASNCYTQRHLQQSGKKSLRSYALCITIRNQCSKQKENAVVTSSEEFYY